MAMMVRGIAHAVAFTWRRRAQGGGAKLRQVISISRRIDSAPCHLQPYCVGVLQAAVLSLIHNVEAPALIVCAIRPTGNLIQMSIYAYTDYFLIDLLMIQ